MTKLSFINYPASYNVFLFIIYIVSSQRPTCGGWLARYVALIILVMSTLCAQSANASSNGISEQAWVEDLSGEMPLSEIKKLPEQPFMGLLSKGYSKAPLWVRLRIDPTPAPAPNTLQTNRNLYLSIRPTFLDSVTLYDLLQDAQQTIAPNQRSGDRVSLNTALPRHPCCFSIYLQVMRRAISG